MFPYLQNVSKHLAQLAVYLGKVRLLWKFIMTRIMTNPELIKPGRKPPIPESIWFCRSVDRLPNVDGRVWVSDLLRSGTVIDQIRIQSYCIDPAVLQRVGLSVTLINSKAPSFDEATAADRVLDWDEPGTGPSWRSYGQALDETWELQKVVHGSDLRLAIVIFNLTLGDVSTRVGVRYTA